MTTRVLSDARADAPATTTVHLRGEGTSILLTTGLAGAPSVVAWGPDLGALDADTLDGVVLGARRTHLGNDPDVILEPGLVPGGWTGWSGRPGLVGHRSDGTAWSPRLIARSISHTGSDGSEREVALGDAVELGTGTLTIDTADDEAGLALRLEIELAVGGSLIARGTLTNRGHGRRARGAQPRPPAPARGRRAARLHGPVGDRAAAAAPSHPLRRRRARGPPRAHGLRPPDPHRRG